MGRVFCCTGRPVGARDTTLIPPLAVRTTTLPPWLSVPGATFSGMSDPEKKDRGPFLPAREGWTFDLFVAVDIESSSLDINDALLLEVAAVACDRELRELARIRFAVRQRPEDIAEAELREPNVMAMHRASGLIAECLSKDAVREPDFDRDAMTGEYHERGRSTDGLLCEWLAKVAGRRKRLVTMAGCSPWWDWSILQRDTPRFAAGLYYRPLDASGLKAAIMNWAGPGCYPDEGEKAQAHRALPDALYAIERMRKIRDFLRVAGRVTQGVNAVGVA
jgi:oligoribonuclease